MWDASTWQQHNRGDYFNEEELSELFKDVLLFGRSKV